MNKTSLLSGIALAAAVVGLSMASPVIATNALAKPDSMSKGLLLEHSELLQTPDSQLIAARRCFYKKVYHKGYYERRFGVVGRKQYHPAYYTSQRVCS